jgi:hypothetical protein
MLTCVACGTLSRSSGLGTKLWTGVRSSLMLCAKKHTGLQQQQQQQQQQQKEKW